jgi:hypothetical protein
MNFESSPTQRAILFALNNTGKHVYAGTVPAHVKARRRAANKVARVSRRINRGQR